MAGTRKDNKGRVLKTGEYQRASDGRYVYQYKDPFGKTRCIYSKDLMKLREKEKLLIKDQLDGIDSYIAGSADLNYVFDIPLKSLNGVNAKHWIMRGVCLTTI